MCPSVFSFSSSVTYLLSVSWLMRNQGDKPRKCVKCGASTAKDPTLVLHRFPRPTSDNQHRTRQWAKYCYPEGDWDSREFQMKLWMNHKMLCSKHFPASAFIEYPSHGKKMSRYAVPSEASVLTLRSEDAIPANPTEIEIHNTQLSEQLTSDSLDVEMDSCVPTSETKELITQLHPVKIAASQILSVKKPYLVYRIQLSGKGETPHKLFTHHLAELKVTQKSVDSSHLRLKEVAFTARGLMPPVFTPLNDDHTINYKAIPGYAKFLADAGIKSVLVGGTTGEHMTLGVSDRKKVVAEWVRVGKTLGLHIMVQVGGAPYQDVIELTKYCAQAGVDSLLTLPELYFKPTSVDALVAYVELVAKAAPNLPVLYYHIPGNTKVDINMPAFVAAASARIPNFKGIKFTSNDLSEGAQVLRNLTGDQEMFLGADTLLAPGALLGIKSSIGTSYNLFPKLAQDILAAVANGDIEQARTLQEKLSLAIEALTAEGPWVPVMKAGMEIATGIKVGPPCLPQYELSSEAKQRIAGKLRALKLAE